MIDGSSGRGLDSIVSLKNVFSYKLLSVVKRWNMSLDNLDKRLSCIFPPKGISGQMLKTLKLLDSIQMIIEIVSPPEFHV